MTERDRRYSSMADEDLMACVEADETGAFAVLYDRHARAAYSLAYRMMGERQTAEDLLQDAFVKVWRSAGAYRAERGSVRTWILSVVHNRGVDQIRAAASRRRTQDKAKISAQTSAATAQQSEAFSETWRNSRRQQVREALNTLPPDQMQVLELAYFSGYTHVEIAELLDVPLGTVKGRMRLGLKKIRDFFGSRGLTVPE